MTSPSLKETIKNTIVSSGNTVFLRQDFEHLGGYDQVGRALRQLISSGVLVKIGHGLFARGSQDPLSGKVFLLQPPDIVQQEAAKRSSRTLSIPLPGYANPLPGEPGERLSKRMGLEFPYDWSNPSMSESLLIRLVLEKGRFRDLIRVAYYFGLIRLRATAKAMFGDQYPGRLSSMLDNIEVASRSLT